MLTQDDLEQSVLLAPEVTLDQIGSHANMSPWEVPRSLGLLSLAYLRNLPRIPAITMEMMAERTESPEFKAAIEQHFEVDCTETDGITRRAWFIPAKNGLQVEAETIVMLPGLSVQHHTGLGRENLWEFHQQLPDHNLLAIGSEGLESSIPPKDWYNDTSFASQARGRLEMIDQLKGTLLHSSLDEYHIVGESMGTVMGFLMAAQAKDYGQTVTEMVAIAPAGIEDTGLVELGHKFVLPEAVDLISRIYSTPVDRVGYYLRTLLGTANINPAAIPVMKKHVQLLASKPAPLQGIGEQLPKDLVIKILAGDCDFVANPRAFYDRLAKMHGNSSLHIYPGEHHMSLTRSHKMARRTADVMSETPQASISVQVHQAGERVITRI